MNYSLLLLNLKFGTNYTWDHYNELSAMFPLAIDSYQTIQQIPCVMEPNSHH
jgi:hypothetical protein